MDVKKVKKIAIFCDGTWCGQAAGTRTNIKILAQCFANKTETPSGVPQTDKDKGVVTIYFDGLGLAGTFSDYLTNGAIAADLADACIAAYAAIVDHFNASEPEVWMFGLSRGAYTVRTVCGMINNWGILDKNKIKKTLGKNGGNGKVEAFTKSLCSIVFAQMQSKDEAYKPKSDFAKRFMKAYCFELKVPPVKFLGLLDTVGALGVPRVDAGVGLAYEFYDQVVSTEVQNVYQALATHDRLGLFTPCFARRNEAKVKKAEKELGIRFVTKEVWFPGAHYDIGRQRFVFPRAAGSSLERTLNKLSDKGNFLGLTVKPTDAFADAPLQWMLDKIEFHDNKIVTEAARKRFVPGIPATRPSPWAGLQAAIWNIVSVIFTVLTFGFVPHWQPGSPEVSINAYDTLVTRMLPKWLNPLKGLALMDRKIPLYREAEFSPAMHLPLVEKHKSQSYHTYEQAIVALKQPAAPGQPTQNGNAPAP
mmetsp:Transcript_2086/g.6170  ORF Transcript_2086/g.6170 Transcript_2086/m.6170 type:complete len:476 (-) Transcript_2086:134-1561(-)|eukprot:CAMPEP_0206136810 /NCGR_PEP_ID=MMETSP1473-20131121/2032_1 /ASSEMBLY_ACC=CAM_ASM_001109 /TAXON_ID=1461547 /ORGANISM="Stichococcus sp, Strain RCC1054" /LENGTH=475 /DNA_ID=CAMNT_0053529597 /DNA_START=941 /DNA_END=2368 /DNA_ORIENTATION=+